MQTHYELELPQILNIPSKLYPIFTQFKNHRFILLHGGRGGGKSHSVARLLLYIAEHYKVRICCGRETQNTIEDSVYKIFMGVIRDNNLNFYERNNKIYHRLTGSEIVFRGFRQSGNVNIKGLEDFDILWIDEAEAITEETLDIIIPTIRKAGSKLIFTMNRKLRRDPVYTEMVNKEENCLIIKINYYENPYCSAELKEEAEKMKVKNPKKYKHVYEGEPEEDSELMLFSADKLDSIKEVKIYPENIEPFRSMAVDLSGAGGDFCECSIIDQVMSTKYKVSDIIEWQIADTDVTVGKIINLYKMFEPDLLTLDADGMGYPIYCSVSKAVENCIAFHGAGKSFRENCANQRADGYLTLQEFVDNQFIIIPQDNCRNQLETIEKRYQTNGGKIVIISKKDYRDKYGESPDIADSVMMNIHSINYNKFMSKRKFNNFENYEYSMEDYSIYD